MDTIHISISYYGKDYSPINMASYRVIDSEILSLENVLDYQKILNRFLDEVDENSFKDNIIISFDERKKKLDSNQKMLRASFNSNLFGGLVGVLKKEKFMLPLFDYITDTIELPEDVADIIEFDITLQITSRFDGDEGEKPYFLTTMLQNAGLNPSNNYVPESEENIFAFLLLFVFIKKFRDSYTKGYFRTYSTFRKNDDRIKGSIDIARHIKFNIGLNNGRIAYSYREKSVDNYLNHLVVEAYIRLKRNYPELVFKFVEADPANADLKNVIDVLKYSIGYPQYDANTLLWKNMNNIAHPYYTEYEELRKICLKILKNDGLTFFDGTGDQVEGVLFYIPDLWEMYVENILKQNLEKDITISAQDEIKIYYQEGKAQYTKKTYPDFVFYYQVERNIDMPFMVLDAKFKSSWGESTNGEKGMSSKDLADYDKCIRDMNSINAHATGVIFPSNMIELQEDEIDTDIEQNEIESKFLVHRISEYNKCDMFYTFPVRVPDTANKNYDSWEKKFNDICDAITKQIWGYIEKEKQFHQNYQVIYKAR